MLKPTVKRGLMLNFIPDEIICAANVNIKRVNKINEKEIIDGDITYIINREYRLEDNWAFVFAQELTEKYKKNLNVIIYNDINSYSEAQAAFLNEGIKILEQNLISNKINYEIAAQIPDNPGAIIIDFNPVNSLSRRIKKVNCAVFEVDSHNIIPAKFVSDKQEFSAATLRRKIYGKVAEFLTEYPNNAYLRHSELVSVSYQHILQDFIQNKLKYYAEHKNNPLKDVTSNLSPYFHFGFISSQRVALEVLKSRASRENKETFLEELIVRKELSDNFCYYAKNFKILESVLPWANETLNAHRYDIRTYIYTCEEFEFAKTHDKFWNKIQNDLLITGKIHGYVRMYWAKKILEWSKTPKEALKIAIYLNDKYALDGIDSNGYVGILWSIAGLHDRPFTNRPVTGKIRYMGLSACKRNFDVNAYINEE